MKHDDLEWGAAAQGRSWPAQQQPLAIQQAPAPGYVSQTQRCGFADREQALARLGNAFARGYLAKDELEARTTAVNEATTLIQLEETLHDLHGVRRFRGISATRPRQDPTKRITKAIERYQPFSGIAFIVLGLIAAILPAGIGVAIDSSIPSNLAAILGASFGVPIGVGLLTLGIGTLVAWDE